MDELEERVYKFNSLSLPGQPMGMHMGTSYLVNDLWREVKRLRGLTPRALDEAIQPLAEHAQNSDIIPAGEVGSQPRQ